jgi:hypothetical protein
MQSKEFHCEITYGPPFLCFGPTAMECEGRITMLERVNKWIEENNVEVINVETSDYKEDNIVVTGGQFTVWYKKKGVVQPKVDLLLE